MSGAINPFVTTKYSLILFSAAMSAATDFATQASKGGKINYSEVTYNFVTGAAIGRFWIRIKYFRIQGEKICIRFIITLYHLCTCCFI